MGMKRCIAVALLGAGVAWLAFSQSGTYRARLSPLPADTKTRPELSGSGTVTGTVAGSKLTVNGTFEGLRSPATSAQLHAAVAAGVRGPVIGDLTITKATSGSVSGSADLTAQQLQYLQKGGIYVQIQSEKAPEGNVWGWFLR